MKKGKFTNAKMAFALIVLRSIEKKRIMNLKRWKPTT